MLITTTETASEESIIRAKQVEKDLNSTYVVRNKVTVSQLKEAYKDDFLVVSKDRLTIYPYPEGEPLFFHPNSASFRIKRLQKGEDDPFLSATKLKEGMFMLDCTLGLASDSIIASYAVGATGRVIGIEGNPFLAYIVKHGLYDWHAKLKEQNRAMRRIEVVNALYLDYLMSCPIDSVDVIYFDPMFTDAIEDSDGIQALRSFALYTDLSSTVIEEAKRVARSRIVLKDHFRSPRFEQYGFEVNVRKTSRFHFGVMELT